MKTSVRRKPMKRIISAVLFFAAVFTFCSVLAPFAAAARMTLDALFVNESVYPMSDNLKGNETLTIDPGDRIYILGWAAFSRTDGLKEIKYSIDGKEYACEDNYRDRSDVAQAGIQIYNNGAHAGFGHDEKMMELTGIDKLEPGSYRLVIKAYSNGGDSATVGSFELTVKGDSIITWVDYLYINETRHGMEADLSKAKRLTVRKNDRVYISGWATFGRSDGLNKIVYTADGAEYECYGAYNDRADVAAAGIAVYNNGAHAGFGKSGDMAELTGIASLPAGDHDVSVIAVSDSGKRAEIRSFTLRVSRDVSTGAKGDVNKDGSINNRDVVMLFRAVSGAAVIDEAEGDVNGDGSMNNKDVSALFRAVSGGELPSPQAEDDYAGTPAYTVSGDKIIVDGVSYPNTVNMKNGALYAMDDLGRELVENGNYSFDGSKNVGVFYFLWLGEHGDFGIYDITKILAEGGQAARSASYSGWGQVGAMHFWGEPLYGYYFSRDKWVMRKHIEELTEANVDFLYIDATNGFPYVNNAVPLMQIMHEFNEAGYTAPKIVFYTHSSCSNTVKTIYNQIYAKNTYPDTWLYVDGKPLIIAYESECKEKLTAAQSGFFTYREPQWPNERQKQNGWPWMDFNYPQRVFYNKSYKAEAISVSVAQHSGTVCFSDSAIYGDRTNRGRSAVGSATGFTAESTLYGYNFQDQFDRAIASGVPYILVTGWNEWVAQRQDPAATGRSGQAVFVDTASMEYSRDIEPMRGGYFDNYYIQLVDNIRKYKGSAPTLVQDTRKKIDINGDFSQWDGIFVTYTDMKGDTVNRDSAAFGGVRLTDNSGRNDIVAAKVVYDTKNIYFYAETADAVTSPDSSSSWMQLFVNADCDGGTGFVGFDYIVNYEPGENGVTHIAKLKAANGAYEVLRSEEISYKVEGNKIMIGVPLASLGIYVYNDIRIAFKWADSKTKLTTADRFYTDGDAAPIGRFGYVFTNVK